MIEIPKYDPIPTIRAFHEDPAQIRCLVGPVGSGKTTGATWEICYLLPKHLMDTFGIKKTRWLIVRNTYSELIDTTQKTVFEWFPPISPFGNYKVQSKDYVLRYPDGMEVEIMFRSCDRPEDVKKFKSLEITGYWIDESIEVKDDIKLMLKNRIGRYPRKCPVRFGIETTNPPDTEDTTYYTFRWHKPPPGPLPLPPQGKKGNYPLENHAGFWQPPYENAVNLRPGYYEDLILDYSGNPDWIARYVRGKPGINVQGKLVYYNFRRDFHVSDQPLQLPPTSAKLYAGWDNTGNCPACVIGWIPTAGRLQILREFHTERMGIVDFCEMVVMERNNLFPDCDWIEWGDPAGEAKFSKKDGGLTSNAELMKDSGILLRKSEQNWEARRESVETQLGKMIGGEPGVLIDPSCTRLINGFIGGYCYPEIGTSGIYGDKPIKNKFSHVHDALQYMMVMLTRNVKAHQRRKQNKNQSYGFTNITDRYRPQDEGYKEYYARV